MAWGTLDGTVRSSTAVGSTVTGTLSTSLTNNIILVATKVSGTTAITGITDSAGLTYNKISHQSITGSRVEFWYAVSSGVLTSNVITITFASAPSFPTMMAVGIHEANLFDSNGSLPAGGTASSTNLGATVSTDNADTMLFGIINLNNTGTTINKPAGWVDIFESAGFYTFGVVTFTSPQVNYGLNFNWTTTRNAALVAHAVKRAAATGNPYYRRYLASSGSGYNV